MDPRIEEVIKLIDEITKDVERIKKEVAELEEKARPENSEKLYEDFAKYLKARGISTG